RHRRGDCRDGRPRGRHVARLRLRPQAGRRRRVRPGAGRARPGRHHPGGIMIKKSGVAALAAVVLALSACGSGSEEPPAQGDGPRVLKLWHYEAADSAMGKAWAEAIKKFEESHPNV